MAKPTETKKEDKKSKSVDKVKSEVKPKVTSTPKVTNIPKVKSTPKVANTAKVTKVSDAKTPEVKETKEKTITKAVSPSKVAVVKNVVGSRRKPSPPKKLLTTSKGVGIVVKGLKQQYLGKCIKNNEDLIIHRCDTSNPNPYKDYINSGTLIY